MQAIEKISNILRIFLIGILVVGTAGSLSQPVQAAAEDIVINEIRVDQTGTDNDEYLELFGPAYTSLNGLTYLVIGDGDASSGSGVIEAVVSLNGLSINNSGYFLITENSFTLSGSVDYSTNLNFENTDNVTHMLVKNFSGTVNSDLDTNDDGVLDVTPWTSVIDKVALIMEENPPSSTEYHYGPPTVGPDGIYSPGHVLRCEEGWRIGQFDTAAGDDTPKAANLCPPLPDPTTTSLISSLNPSTVGDSVTFTAQVSPVETGTFTPSGTVTFLDGSTILSSETLDASAQAFFSTDSLSAGSHTITAQYGGDENFAVSSTQLIQTVNDIVVPEPPDVFLSEIRTDQTSTDNDEYFELGGAAGESLDGLTYLVIGDGAGGSGTIEAVVDLNGQVMPASGYFVAAESTFTLGAANLVTSINFENSDNTTHLIVFEFTGADGDDLDTDDDGVLDVTPWSEMVDLVAIILEDNPPSSSEYHYGPPMVGPDGSYAPGHVFLCEDGWWIGQFDIAAGNDTPGAANICVPPLAETTTSLLSSLNPSSVGDSITFTAQVSPVETSTFTPSGTVTFLDGSTVLSSETLDASAQAFLSTDALGVGSHTITAQYSGDENFAASSIQLVQVVEDGTVITAPEVKLSEIRTDQTSTDNDEYFELSGEAGESLDGLTYLVIGDGAGGSGTIEAVVDLSGQVMPASGYFVAAESTFTLGTADLVTSINFENSDNTTHLIVFEFTGANGDDLDTDDDGLLDVKPWTEIVDLVAIILEDNPPSSTEYHYGPPTVGPDGDYAPGHVFRCGDNWLVGGFELGTNDTPGQANLCPVPEFLINELDSDTPGTDVLEFVEIYDGGFGNTALEGLVLVLYNGSNDLIYQSYDLDGYSTNEEGYFVLGSVPEADYVISASSWLQNGADAAALYEGSDTDLPIGGSLSTENLLDALVYDTDDADDAELLVLLNPDQPQINENEKADKDNQSMQRCPNASGGARNTDTYDLFPPTPGSENLCEIQEEEVCGDPYTAIYEIQGSGTESPLLAQVVSVEGVVSGDFQGSEGLNGFFIQDPAGDSNEETSDGIFVFAPASLDISVGDRVRVKGTVSEYYELTEITSVSSLLFCETTLPLEPVMVDLPVTEADDLEIYEGMLVTFPEALTVTEHYDLGRYGELSLSADGRLFNTTNDQGATALENSLRRLLLDDGSTVENPALVPYLAADNTLRLGDTISGLTGNLTYAYGEYAVEPTLSPEIIRVNERPAAPDDNGGVITIASFNVLNYFTTIHDGVNDARGADSLEEFERQKAKLVNAILTMDADIVGLMEIENNADLAVEDLVSGLNAASAEGTYAAVPQPVVGLGDDAIKVALIYKPASATPIGLMMTDEDPVFSRPPAGQTFSGLWRSLQCSGQSL